jgi:hypothetical protein
VSGSIFHINIVADNNTQNRADIPLLISSFMFFTLNYDFGIGLVNSNAAPVAKYEK